MRNGTRRQGAVVWVAALSLHFFTAAEDRAWASCEQNGADAPAIAAARAAMADACPCDAAGTHAAYVQCAAGVVADRVGQSLLPADCATPVVRCARRSTCGRPGAVTCFRTVNGKTRCAIERSAAECTAPPGGSVCGGDLVDSCCDSCTAAACEPTPNPTHTPFHTPDPCDPLAQPTCTPPPCPGPSPFGGPCSGCTYACPFACCPNGCGTICVPPTPAP